MRTIVFLKWKRVFRNRAILFYFPRLTSLRQGRCSVSHPSHSRWGWRRPPCSCSCSCNWQWRGTGSHYGCAKGPSGGGSRGPRDHASIGILSKKKLSKQEQKINQAAHRGLCNRSASQIRVGLFTLFLLLVLCKCAVDVSVHG